MRNTKQRQKVDESENYLFLVLKMLELNGDGEVTKEQVSLVLLTTLL